MKMIELSSSRTKWFCLFVCTAVLSACATPYQPMSALGGYREIQLASDTYRVMFFGNGYTNAELAVEYALHRCAELAQQNGYRYFGILDVNDLSEQRSWNIPGSAYTTGNLSVNSFGNTAFGTYNQQTFITPAQTIRFNFPRPVITMQMVNNQTPGAKLFEANIVLSNQLPGVPNTSIARTDSTSPKYAGARIDQDPRLNKRVLAFVTEFVAASQSGSSLPPPISFYGPNIVFNGSQLSHQAMAQQIQSAFDQWPQRSFHLISGPTIIEASQDPGGSVVTYEIAFVFKNEQKRFEGKASVQLRVETQGDQLAITSISPKMLEQSGPT
jgi:hypothetical protein